MNPLAAQTLRQGVAASTKRFLGTLLGCILLASPLELWTMDRMPGRLLISTLGRCAVAAAAISLCAASGSPAQPAAASDPFATVAFLVGRWEGTSEGQPGTGTLRREYERALGGRFIRIRNRSEYPAQAKNPKGEIHEDEGYLSFDRARKRLVLRQFHVEGFVNQYVQDEGAAAPGRVVFTTEAIENIPAGWRARETYVLQGPDAFEEIFELAEADKPFEVYSRARLRRVK